MKYFTKQWFLAKIEALRNNDEKKLGELALIAKTAKAENKKAQKYTTSGFNVDDCAGGVLCGVEKRGADIVVCFEDVEILARNAEIKKNESFADEKRTDDLTILTAIEMRRFFRIK